MLQTAGPRIVPLDAIHTPEILDDGYGAHLCPQLRIGLGRKARHREYRRQPPVYEDQEPIHKLDRSGDVDAPAGGIDE